MCYPHQIVLIDQPGGRITLASSTAQTARGRKYQTWNADVNQLVNAHGGPVKFAEKSFVNSFPKIVFTRETRENRKTHVTYGNIHLRMCACASVFYCTKISSYLPFTSTKNFSRPLLCLIQLRFTPALSCSLSKQKKLFKKCKPEKNTRKRNCQKMKVPFFTLTFPPKKNQANTFTPTKPKKN